VSTPQLPERNDRRQVLSARACLSLVPVVDRLGGCADKKPAFGGEKPRRRRCEAMLLALKRVPGATESSFAICPTATVAPTVPRALEKPAALRLGGLVLGL